jgi:bifunctional pyridoxal-dependent enzyme with beta-cystathionase and maltose regulon repressor activities
MPSFAELADQITPDELRARGSVKWSRGGPDAIGAFIAEMDFGAAPPIEAALTEAVSRADFGYLGDRLAAQLPDVRYRPPDGTYLAWLDCRDLFAALGPSAASPAEFFLAKAQVVPTDGAACGDAGAGHVRLNFATPRPILAEIVRRLATATASA